MDWKKDYWLIRQMLFSGVCLYLLACCGLKEEKEAPLDEALTASNQALILGDWYPLDSMPLNLTGYCFLPDNLCRNHLGFYEYADPENGPVLSHPDTWNVHPDSSLQAPGYAWMDNVIRCYGHQSVYEVRNDRLKIFDPSRKDWVELRMEFLSVDTLVLVNTTDSIRETYTRRNDPVTDGDRMFDELIFYFPYSHYSEEVFFSVKHTGLLINRGFRYSRFHKGIIEEGAWQQIESRFRQADFITPLAGLYCSSREEQTIDKRIPNITFAAKGKINTLNDPVGQVPVSNRAFYWAYFSALFLQDYLHLTPYDWVYENDSYDKISWGLAFNNTLELRLKDSTKMGLFPSEEFYLYTLLLDSKATSQRFTSHYQLKGFIEDFWKKIPVDVETDGRYFTYTVDGYNGPYTQTFDIGFNFIHLIPQIQTD